MFGTPVYPIQLKFSISTFANDFTVTDAQGQSLLYVRQKIFTWRDRVKVYRDKSQTEQLYSFTSNKLIDFQQTFSISNQADEPIGFVRRKTIKSFWKATFNLSKHEDQVDYVVRENNPWTKFWDSLLGEIPVLGFLSGYLFHPSYILRNAEGEELLMLKKESSFFGRKFSIEKLQTTVVEEERLLLSLMLVVLLERQRG